MAPLQVDILELQKKVLGEKHPATITAMAHLALTWRQQGRSDEAEKLQVDVLELRKKVPLTWRQQGHSDEAERLQMDVSELRKKVLGEKHPDTITAMDNLPVMQEG
jgi:hypothetical protein